MSYLLVFEAADNPDGFTYSCSPADEDGKITVTPGDTITFTSSNVNICITLLGNYFDFTSDGSFSLLPLSSSTIGGASKTVTVKSNPVEGEYNWTAELTSTASKGGTTQFTDPPPVIIIVEND
jgi:plastocyanin